MKKYVAVLALLLFAVAFTACGAAEAVHEGVFPLEDVLHDPQAHMGQISIMGVAGISHGNEFVLLTPDGERGIVVEYRGSQAMPTAGATLVVTGSLRAQRPCCGDGYEMHSTSFEVVTELRP